MTEQEKTNELDREIASHVDATPTRCPECNEIIEYHGDTLLHCPNCGTTWRVEVIKL